MRDFSLTIYKKLLAEFRVAGYELMTFADFIQFPEKNEKTVILRHDVDRKPLRSLRTAEMENGLGIRGTYYFRVIKGKLPEAVIVHIARLGQEIGYHYDDLNTAHGEPSRALESFQKNLAYLRELAPIKTACMHGSPMSRFDNRDMWKERNYREFGIIAEPYFDIDFNKVLYLTDTGRRWDGDRVSIRDRVSGEGRGVRDYREEKRGERQEAIGDGEDGRMKIWGREQKEKECRGSVCDPPALCPHSTSDIIRSLKNKILPDKIMLTVHPQRWTDNVFSWMVELIWQTMKNPIKSIKRKRMEKHIK